MKIVLFKLWTNYTERCQRPIFHTVQVYLDNSSWNQ